MHEGEKKWVEALFLTFLSRFCGENGKNGYLCTLKSERRDEETGNHRDDGGRGRHDSHQRKGAGGRQSGGCRRHLVLRSTNLVSRLTPHASRLTSHALRKKTPWAGRRRHRHRDGFHHRLQQLLHERYALVHGVDAVDGAQREGL